VAEFYLPLRTVHVWCAALTIALFVWRGMLMIRDSELLGATWLRILPHAIDTVLLASALALTTIVHQYPLADAWLTVKLVLLVAYVLLGSIALRYGRTKGIRIVALVGALLAVAAIVVIARARDPSAVLTMIGAAWHGGRGMLSW
jgi:uncharacterized membrane protein SirB2